MALKTIVKINHVSNLSDARYCAGMGVDYLGFNLEKGTEFYVDPREFTEITDWISGPEYIAEFPSYNADEIAKTIQEYKIDAIEITNPESVRQVKDMGKPVIIKLDIDTFSSVPEVEKTLENLSSDTGFVILRSKQPGLVNLKNLQRLSESFKIMAGYGITDRNVLELIKKTKILGIALDSKKESEVGFKDYDQLADILEVLETE